MNTDNWHDFLKSQGAQWDDQGIAYFGEPHADTNPENTHLIDTNQLGCLLVSGPDSRKFLQGQVTSDIDALTPEHSITGAHCNTKGRMLFSFRAIDLSTDDEMCIALIIPTRVLASAQQALQKYIVFSKAKLSPIAPYRLMGLSGSNAETVLQKTVSAPQNINDVSTAENIKAIKINGSRFLCLVNIEAEQTLWQQWATNCQQAGHWQWLYENIREGNGVVEAGGEDLFLPQMLNYDITGGVSFKKGCYIGQEVVARMHYKGQLKRHMRRGKFLGSDSIQPGAPVFSNSKEQSVGNVVSAAPVGNDQWECLFVVTDTAFEENGLYLNDSRLEALPLPYEVK